MVEYSSASEYIDTATSIRAKITAIDAIISALLTVAANAAATDNITEYMLDDGQTKINTVYKGTSGVYASIKNFENLKQYYINKLNPRRVRLVDSKNFR